MAGTSTPAKRPRSAQASAPPQSGFLPLIVDAHSGSILHVAPLRAANAGRTAKSGSGATTQGHELLYYELQAAGGAPVRYVVLLHGKRERAVDAARALADEGLAIDLDAVSHKEGARESLLRSLLEKTLASFKEIQGRHAGGLTEDELIREVGETLADKVSVSATSVEEGWQELLERGLRSKVAMLKSGPFKSTTQASELLGIGEPAVRKRIREQKLFALKVPGDGEHRIPAWALDPGVAGAAAASLYASVPGMDEWQLYHFLSTPNGNLNGLRPFECLLSSATLTPSLRAARDELVSELELGAGASLLAVVEDELKAEAREGRAA
ncbi:hypothetical protein [Paracidovorax cattleyae]|uniref:Uncharacterized protein n=1 Tax=Paracidovorax cattleyae TaxID=80868 RepID=A0A1H0MCM4_9BURK|nr:hypothetical protein [Paracidovorax cattleyae]SDO78198.1 hypothetical protein SAMN04489708_103213 [Paracidovorax cattleyae]